MVKSQIKFSFLLESKTETENSLIQESNIENLDSFIPRRIPPEDPSELLYNQKLMLLLKALSCLFWKVSFLVSCIATISILCFCNISLSALRLLERPRPLAFQQRKLIIRNYSTLRFY